MCGPTFLSSFVSVFFSFCLFAQTVIRRFPSHLASIPPPKVVMRERDKSHNKSANRSPHMCRPVNKRYKAHQQYEPHAHPRDTQVVDATTAVVVFNETFTDTGTEYTHDCTGTTDTEGTGHGDGGEHTAGYTGGYVDEGIDEDTPLFREFWGGK